MTLNWKTPGLQERLASLASECLSARVIAITLTAELGVPVTRNMVVARCGRTQVQLRGDLPFQDKMRRARQRKTEAIQANKARGARVQAAGKDPPAKPPGKLSVAVAFGLQPRPNSIAKSHEIDARHRAERTKAVEDPRGHYAKPFLERQRNECAYLLGHGAASKVCAAPVAREGSSYCPYHVAICYIPTYPIGRGRPRKDANVVETDKVEKEEAEEIELVEGNLFDPIGDETQLVEDVE